MPTGAPLCNAIHVRKRQVTIAMGSVRDNNGVLPIRLTTCSVSKRRKLFIPGATRHATVGRTTTGVKNDFKADVSFTHDTSRRLIVSIAENILNNKSRCLTAGVHRIGITIGTGCRLLLVSGGRWSSRSGGCFVVDGTFSHVINGNTKANKGGSFPRRPSCHAT